MLIISTIEKALYDWVYAITGGVVFFADQNIVEQTEPYTLLNIVTTTPLSMNEKVLTEVPGDYSVDIDYSKLEELLVSVNCFANSYTAFQTATTIKDGLDSVTVREALYASGLGLVKAGAVQKIDEVVSGQWQYRAQFDCTFHVRTLSTENIEEIRTIEVTNELDGTTKIIDYPT